jgi:hypothetical protein
LVPKTAILFVGGVVIAIVSRTMILFFCLPLAVVLIAARRHKIMVLEMTLTAAFFVAGLHSVRFAVYLMIAAVGMAASLPAWPIWSARAQRVTGALAIGAIVAICAVPSVPSGSVAAETPVQAFKFLAARLGRIFTEYTWCDYSIARGVRPLSTAALTCSRGKY